MITKLQFQESIDTIFTRLCKLEGFTNYLSPAYMDQSNKYLNHMIAYKQLYGEAYTGRKLYD